MAVQVLGCLVLVCAFLGFTAWLSRARGLSPAWVPTIVLSGWSAALMVGGLVDLLPVTAAAIVIGGIVLGAVEVARHRQALRTTLLSPALLLFALMACGLAVHLWESVLTHYDNFSHWGLVVQVMLERDGFPTDDDPLVQFTTYPLGAASLGYLAGRVVSPTDLPVLMVHNLWIVSGALPLVAMAGRAWRWAVVPTVVCMVLLMTSITTPNSLLVDPLIASQVGWAALFVFSFRGRLASRLPELSLVLAALVAVKTSGALLALVLAVVALVVARRQEPRGAQFWLLSPLLMIVAWQVHVTRTFQAADEAKHSVSASRYARILGDKSPDQLTQIVRDFTWAVVTAWPLWLAVGILVVVAVSLLRHGLVSARTAASVLLLTALMTALWFAGLLATYALSMPTREALALAGFDRYTGTWLLAVIVLSTGLCLALWRSGEKGVGPWATVLATALPLGLVTTTLAATGPAMVFGITVAEHRQNLEEGLDRLTIEPDDTLCVAVPGDDRGLTGYLVRYLTLHPHVRSGVISEDTVPAWVRDCTQALIVTPQPEARAVLEAHGLEPVEVP